MQSISTTFTRAATGDADTSPGFSVFWLMVLAIAILDDSDRREKERRRKQQAHAQPQRKPIPPAGPRPF